MKKILSLFAVLLLCGSVNAQMQALFSYSTFFLPERQQPYVETYLQFDVWTMHFVEVAPGSYRAAAEVTIVLSQQDSVCYAKKYDLSSPTVPSLDQLDFSFLDVQRFSVRNGIYDMTVSLRDKGTDAPESVVTEKLVINFPKRQQALSSVMLVASVKPTEKENILSRGGYDMEPYVSDFVPEQVKQLNFYYEIYNMDLYFADEVHKIYYDKDNNVYGGHTPGEDAVLAMTYVEELETGRRVEDMKVMSRKTTARTMPVLGSLDISELPSGNYNLVCEVRDRDNHLLLYRRLPFYRSNPGVKGKEVSEYATTFAGRYTDEDQLNLYLDGLYPIASDAENNIVKDLVRRPALEEKQAFLYTFWQRRNALDPEGEWLKYKERIDYVQEHFSYPRTRGIVTDRGRVYLQYGPPDFIRDEKNYVSANRIGSNNEQTPSTMQLGNAQRDGSPMYQGTSQGHVFYLPYQLWRYNKLATDDPNRVFLFWDEHRSGYYTLLNSNARGEVQDPGWERRLCRQQLNEGVVGEVGEQFNRGY